MIALVALTSSSFSRMGSTMTVCRQLILSLVAPVMAARLDRFVGLRLAISSALLGVMLGACTLAVRGSFSPVRGPLAEIKPAPNYSARMTGALSGEIAVAIPTDGSCAGRWSLLGSQQQSFDLSSAWDQVYGAGYYTAHVLGVREFVRTTLNCTGGAPIRIEVSNEKNTRGNTRGVAEDDRGNIFKVSVYN